MSNCLWNQVWKKIFLAALHGTWDLSSPTRHWTHAKPALEVGSLNHWTAREIHEYFILFGLKNFFIFFFFTISCAFMIVFHPSFIWSFSTNWFYNLLQMVQLSQVPEMLFLNFPLCKISNDVAYNFLMMSSSSTEVLYSVKVLWAKGCRSYHKKGSHFPGVSLAPDEFIP